MMYCMERVPKNLTRLYSICNDPSHSCQAQRAAEDPIQENSSTGGRFLIWAHMQAIVLSPGNVHASKIDFNSTASLNFCNNIDSCVVPELMLSSPHFKVQVELKGQNCCASVAAMVDCGAIT
jgi:hypothetical protein